ncbi:MAG TPA: ATP-binding protein [Isosphaeraceae bacterium]|jgi:PAS domain S-box-containing protein|nr:ATP-binding protein [Isosphaeraceae bacterium]
MNPRLRRIVRYGAAGLLVALAINALMIPAVGPQLGTLLILAVLLAAWIGGFGPGLLASLLIVGVAAVVMAINPKTTSWQYLGLALFGGALVLVSALIEALHAARRRWEAALRSVGDAVITTDARGRVAFLNPVARDLTGWGAEAVGRPLAEVFRVVDEESRVPVDGSPARALREGKVVGPSNHSVLLARDGSERPVQDSAAPIRDVDDNVAGVVLVFRDDTQRRNYERELVEAGRRKDEFLAMLAHELRNPLGAIQSASQVLEAPGTAENDDWARRVIARQVDHLTYMLDDLLDVSRITRGKVRVRPRPIDAVAVVRQAVEVARPLFDEREHALAVSIGPGPLGVEADPIRLEQVLVNLLANAAKYTPPGGNVRLRAGREGDDVAFTVTDDGVGIPAESLPRIFDIFVQGDRSLARSEGGLGLGLAIVKSLVELHGGTVTARSAGPNAGSEFTVRLPALAPAPVLDRWPEAATAPAPAATPPTPEGAGLRSRILIIDDNEDLARGLCRLLRLLGHEVEAAHDGPTGLDAARARRPDVVLLDIGLPVMDGYEVARHLRAEPDLAGVRIIAVSGYGQDEDRRRSKEAGMDHHLTKPVDIKSIMELISAT